jgi:flagellar hook-associated protein FlgK
VSGVSIDEELTLMLRHQQAYTAASRLVKAADEMAQTILNMI